MKDQLVRVSKRMSYLLRHAPQSAGLVLDEHGWVGVADLIAAGHLDRAVLDAVVAGNDKQRFAVEIGSDGRERIRASQGHSVPVDLGLAAAEPPPALFHGTSSRNVESIRRGGIKRGKRHHVHLSPDRETATAVGRRRGPQFVAILSIDSGRMARDGFSFYRSANGVWLTDYVPTEYIER